MGVCDFRCVVRTPRPPIPIKPKPTSTSDALHLDWQPILLQEKMEGVDFESDGERSETESTDGDEYHTTSSIATEDRATLDWVARSDIMDCEVSDDGERSMSISDEEEVGDAMSISDRNNEDSGEDMDISDEDDEEEDNMSISGEDVSDKDEFEEDPHYKIGPEVWVVDPHAPPRSTAPRQPVVQRSMPAPTTLANGTDSARAISEVNHPIAHLNSESKIQKPGAIHDIMVGPSHSSTSRIATYNPLVDSAPPKCNPPGLQRSFSLFSQLQDLREGSADKSDVAVFNARPVVP